MSRSNWKSLLAEAININKKNDITSMYASLSTIEYINGHVEPRNRTVVIRLFNEDNKGELVISTLTTSSKWKELQNNHAFEICWYFKTTREQFRLRGNRIILHDDSSKLSQQIWNSMSPAAKSLFAKTTNSPPTSSSNTNFGVISFYPSVIDYVNLFAGDQATTTTFVNDRNKI
jgi:pyridoxamine 5'-phosphate oxidase